MRSTLVVLLLLVKMISGASVFYSGDGDGDPRESCDLCLSNILTNLRALSGTGAVCNQVSRLTECFSGCSTHVDMMTDPLDIKHLQMLQKLATILTQLRASNCEVDEDKAPGCDDRILKCLTNTVVQQFPKDRINCSDSSMLTFLQCTASLPECEWRDHVETITSQARKSVCKADDRCITGSTLFIVSPGCNHFRFEGLDGLDRISSQREQATAPGTLFDIGICGLQHAALVNCRAT